MSDLSAVLRKTIDALPSAGPRLRAQVYEKARRAVERQIAAANPPLSNETVTWRVRTLEAAIEQTEFHYSGEVRIDPTFDGESSFIPPVESQSDVAVVFFEDNQGLLNVDVDFGGDKIGLTPGTRDRHSEVVRAADRLLQRLKLDGVGSNSGAGLLEAIEDLRDALGNSLESVRPGLLIARGERLRGILSQQQLADADFSDIVPLPPSIVAGLGQLVRVYNAFVALDPELARQDEALLGPDAVLTISPHEGRELMSLAFGAGLVSRHAQLIVEEYAKNVPVDATVLNRQSRKYTESIRNFIRAAAASARSLLVKGAVALGLAAAAAQWMVANETAILAVATSNPILREFVLELIQLLKRLPLAGL